MASSPGTQDPLAEACSSSELAASREFFDGPNDLRIKVENTETYDLLAEPSSPELAASDFFTEDKPYEHRHMNVKEILATWSLVRLFRQLGSRNQCVAFAEAHGLVATEKKCNKHHRPMSIEASSSRLFGSWICRKRSCRGKAKVSRTIGTIFENTKISIQHVFYLIYAFSQKWRYEMATLQDPWKEENGQCLSHATICNWYSHCREVIVAYQLENLESKEKIGGPGKIVHIDKAKFGKRKYKKACHLEGRWILGINEVGSEDLRLEMCPEHEPSAEVLVPLIKKHLKPETTICTDNWEAFKSLGVNGFVHMVNDLDSDNSAPNGIKIKHVESQWRAAKRNFKKHNYYYNPENFADVLVEFMWRSNITKYRKDPFMETIKAIKYVYSTPQKKSNMDELEIKEVLIKIEPIIE